ncbi:MAG: DUF1385 domain-containing protein [Gaiellaceae bacterium]
MLCLILGAKKGTSMYGGQAVIEGVMMRSPSYWAVAVRKPNGELVDVWQPVSSPMKRHWFFRLPVVRGVMALGESLGIGFRALAISTRFAAEGEDGEEGIELGRWTIVSMFVFAIAFAVALFKVSPAVITRLLPVGGNWFVIVEGAIRVTILVLYLAIVSLLPDLRRVFAYHGAEHRVINAYEAKEELTPEKVMPYSVIHPRCGTAFLLWVMVIAIFVFAFFGRPNWYWLIATRILLLPLIAGIAYELIRFAGKHRSSRVLAALLAPGLWLQRLTTREPSLDQVEVSIAAFKRVYELETAQEAELESAPSARPIDVMA